MTTEQAHACIEELKKIIETLIFLPLPAGVNKYEVISYETSNIYEISIGSGKANPEKHNFCGRLKSFDTPLLRLDVSPTNKHYNKDGVLIEGSHWHIYHEGDDRKAFACPEMTSNSFSEQAEAFLEKFSIDPMPDVQERL